jgi:hypothetical protein
MWSLGIVFNLKKLIVYVLPLFEQRDLFCMPKLRANKADVGDTKIEKGLCSRFVLFRNFFLKDFNHEIFVIVFIVINVIFLLQLVFL